MRNTIPTIMMMILMNFIYSQECYSNTDCQDGFACIPPAGDCDFATGPGECFYILDSGCTGEWDPVCGCDGATYSNGCNAILAGVGAAYGGECEQENTECYSSTDCQAGFACISYPGDCNFETYPGYCLELLDDCIETTGIGYCDCNGNDVEDISSLECLGGGVDYYGDCEPPCDDDICLNWYEDISITEEDAIYNSNFYGEIGWTYEISQDTIWIRQTVPQFEGEEIYELVLKDNGSNNLPEFIRFSVHIYWMMPYDEYSYELEMGEIEIQDWDFNELHTGKISNYSLDHTGVFYFWTEAEEDPQIGASCFTDAIELGYYNCYLQCYPILYLENGLGDGICDDFWGSAELFCPEFGYDCGDCNADWDGTDPLGFCGEDYDGPVWHIATDGSDETGDGSVDNPFATIQHGINTAVDGDTVMVAPGTYFETLNIWNKNIVLTSQFLIDENNSTIDSTIIDASFDEGQTAVNIGYTESSNIISGFTIQGAHGYTPHFDDNGGGVLLVNSDAKLKNLIIRNNHMSGFAYSGGIAIVSGGSPLIENVLIYNNSQEWGGPIGIGVFGWGNDIVTPVFNKVTIADSTDINEFHGILTSGNNTMVTFSNSIIWNHSIEIQSGGTINAEYSNIQGGWDGEGNINTDPLFNDPENGDFTLQPNSPCIDTGDPNSPLDPDGTVADMGAFYYHQEDTEVTFSLGDIDYVNNTVEVWMNNTIDVGGAQLLFSGFEIGGVSGGLGEEYDWEFTAIDNSVILSDFQGSTIPPSNAIFFNVSLDNVNGNEICIIYANVYDAIGQALNSEIEGGCIPYNPIDVTLSFDCPESVEAGSEGNILPIEVEALIDVMGFQFDIPFDSTLIEITDVTSGDLLTEMLSWGFSEDTLRILSYDFNGTPNILAGEGNLLNIHYNVLNDVDSEIQFGIENVIMSNENGQEITSLDVSDECTVPIDQPFTDQCVDLTGMPFPECALPIGFGIYGGQCTQMYCSPIDGNGNDWSPWIYETLEECEETCPQETVHFYIPNQFTYLGDSLNLEILMDNNAGSAGGIQMDYSYDEDLIDIYSIFPGAQFPPDWTLSTTLNSILSFSFGGTYLMMGSNQQIFQMETATLNEGTSIICLDDILVSDPNGLPWPASAYCGILSVEELQLEYFTDVLNGQLDMVLSDIESNYGSWDWFDSTDYRVPVQINEIRGVDIGDEIGLQDAAGSLEIGECPGTIGNVLVGAGVYTGGPMEITTYRSMNLCDNGAGDLVYPGWNLGNEIIVKIWDRSENVEYNATPSFIFGDGTWRTDSIVIDVLEALSVTEREDIPTQFKLHELYPNPFNPVTNIQFSIPEIADIEIAVYDIMGRKIETLYSGNKQIGHYNFAWETENLSAGIYFIHLKVINSGNPVQLIRKGILLK